MVTDFDLLVKGKKPIEPEKMHRKGDYPPFFEFKKPGASVVGELSDLREIEFENGRAKVVTLTTAEGTKYSISLTSRLEGLKDMIGKKVAIRYLGIEQTGSFFTKDFEVYEV